jgi:hypothetical protein
VKPGGIQGPQTARMSTRPAARTAVERANDQALEYAILAARWGGLLLALAALVGAWAWVWTWDARWGFTAILAALVGGSAGYWGWWLKGNEEWRS